MEEILKDFGLSDNETTVYLALLKIGNSTANRVAEITGLKRSTTYDNLNLLASKGIVSTIIKGSTHYYEPADPDKLLYLLDEKRSRIQQIIPKLKNLKESIKEKTGVTYFEGKKGVLTVLNDILDQNKELWFYGSRKKASSVLEHYPDDFILKREQHQIFLRAVLAEEDRGHPFYKSRSIARLSDLRFSKELNSISSNVFIYGDRVAFMSSGQNPVGIIIVNSEILEQQKKIFEILWKTAKK
ncbi:MAG TPA: helix-turn-helix domain-containing protein [Candidatus Nanoarchaeia archaeon]|nr:helix-turn-helix domain-containing protein [Candidatus Nanoarchaeia archaeon]